LKDYCDYSLYI